VCRALAFEGEKKVGANDRFFWREGKGGRCKEFYEQTHAHSRTQKYCLILNALMTQGNIFLLNEQPEFGLRISSSLILTLTSRLMVGFQSFYDRK
jgi:hypothetical protein